MNSRLLKALAREGRVRIYICDTTAIVQEAKQRHDLWPTASAALGRVLSVGVMMGSNLKSNKEKLNITINGGGPIGTIMVDAYSDGSVRGFVGDPHVHYQYNDTNKLAVGVAVGKNGYLEVKKDMGLKEDFGGKIALQTGEIGDDFAYYFALSEQTPSIVSVGVLVENDNNIIASGGLLIQMMPDATEEDICVSEEIIKTLKPMSTLLQEGNTLEGILKSLYDDVKVLEERKIHFQCNCSRERMYQALTTLSVADLKDMIEKDHGCEVNCQFCGNSYQFNEEELKQIVMGKNN
ncbi:MAG: Hsp33 family molecular chaperone HslO [Erysipelotrichia bacterium]|nr:Hsp33 family molecular chaperone HslO [Erysipelotrichia bacterium]NCC54343.1 Hsp33 family molecular chaperone HslO [Erysipelotrichia bacterium]